MELTPGRERCLEILIPLLAFGSTLGGIVLWQAGLLAEIQYAALGGFLASCLLAYLAWLLPRKDIVALSTPLYGLIFLVTPIDYAGGVILQILYAAGLTILVARLHYRFGHRSGHQVDDGSLEGPLRDYADRVAGTVSPVTPEQARSIGAVVIRFSTADYKETGRLADRARADLEGAGGPEILRRALSIVSEHARTTDESLPLPVSFLTFSPGQEPFLAHPVPAGADPEQQFMTALYNALILLFVTAWSGSPSDRGQQLHCRNFAGNLYRR